MKILKISANFLPRRCGVGDYTRLLCECLVRLDKGLSFHIITSADPQIIESGYSHERIEILPKIKRWSFACLSQIKEIIKNVSPDLVHIEYNRSLYGKAIAMNFLPYVLKKQHPRRKIFITFHDVPGPIRNRDPFFWLTSLCLFIYCDKIMVSNDIDFNFVCRFPFVKKKCLLVPVGSNIPKIDSNRTATRKELKISDDTVLLVYFGFIREDKCLSDLFYAFSKLLGAERNLKLLIMGGVLNNEIFSLLQKLSLTLHIDDAILWKGYQGAEKVSAYLSASDVIILPYKNGVGTNSGIFAAGVLHGLPILSTYAKCMPEIIKNDYNMLLVKPSNTKELTNALFRITEDSELRNRLSKNLKELDDYLSWQSIARTIFNLYTQVK